MLKFHLLIKKKKKKLPLSRLRTCYTIYKTFHRVKIVQSFFTKRSTYSYTRMYNFNYMKILHLVKRVIEI